MLVGPDVAPDALAAIATSRSRLAGDPAAAPAWRTGNPPVALVVLRDAHHTTTSRRRARSCGTRIAGWRTAFAA
jgi:hypothetical protein